MEGELQLVDLFKNKESFIEYLDISSLTLKCYKNGVESFFDYLNKNNIQYPTRINFKEYRNYLKEEKSTNTVNSYMTAIRMFFKYLESNGIYENITKDVKSLKTSKTAKTQVLTQEKAKYIYNNLVDDKEKCLYSIAISTGLRANEIANAKIENIKNYNGQLVLYVKCKKRDDESEFVKISDKVYENIKNYIGDRKEGFIFISTSNHNSSGGVTNKTIRLWIKNIFKRFGIEEDWFSCHSLRRTFATISYQNGKTVYDIQQVLHHSSPMTSYRYINQCTRNSNNIEIEIGDLILG